MRGTISSPTRTYRYLTAQNDNVLIIPEDLKRQCLTSSLGKLLGSEGRCKAPLRSLACPPIVREPLTKLSNGVVSVLSNVRKLFNHWTWTYLVRPRVQTYQL